MFTPLTSACKLSSQVANGRAIDVSTRRPGITHRGIMPSILISALSHFSLYQFSFGLSQTLSPNSPNPVFPHTHLHTPRSRPACDIAEMSSATFACILTGRDGVAAQCLPDSLIHQLSPGRSQQEEEEGLVWGVERDTEC